MNTEQGPAHNQFWNASRTLALGIVTLVAFLALIYVVSP
jgi:hypothetical protein